MGILLLFGTKRLLRGKSGINAYIRILLKYGKRGGRKMNTLLMGNGINIQYARDGISNKDIMLRVIDNIKSGKINTEVLIDDPNLLLSFLGICYRQVNRILNREYENIFMTSSEKLAYNKFLLDYSRTRSLRITDIGFEDYFFIFRLLSRENKFENSDTYSVRITLERLFIDAIYNGGGINEVHKNYPENLKNYFNKFDNIFTTNYDRNIECFSNKGVYYLHGAFHIRDDVYDPKSLRNYLSDAPLNEIEVDENFYHLYSNAITTYSGNNKLFRIKQGGLANEALEKFTYGYANNKNIKMTIDGFKDSDNRFLVNLYESVLKKIKDFDLSFSESYPIKEFENIKGNISIVGLAPNNDVHLFEMINDNPDINKVSYYYHNSNKNDEIRDMLNNKNVEFKKVIELWNMYA